MCRRLDCSASLAMTIRIGQLSGHKAGRAIVIPLAARAALPAYENESLLTVKATSLASTVTLLDLTGMARLAVTETFAPYEVTARAIYFCITTTLSWLLRRLERRFATDRLRSVVKGRAEVTGETVQV